MRFLCLWPVVVSPSRVWCFLFSIVVLTAMDCIGRDRRCCGWHRGTVKSLGKPDIVKQAVVRKMAEQPRWNAARRTVYKRHGCWLQQLMCQNDRVPILVNFPTRASTDAVRSVADTFWVERPIIGRRNPGRVRTGVGSGVPLGRLYDASA